MKVELLVYIFDCSNTKMLKNARPRNLKKAGYTQIRYVTETLLVNNRGSMILLSVAKEIGLMNCEIA